MNNQYDFSSCLDSPAEQSFASDRKLYNSRIINVYIKLIKSRYSHIIIRELLEHAGMEPYQIEDEGHWFTQEQVNRFHDKLRELTDNKNIAREAGRYSITPDSIGMIHSYILSLVGPARAYQLIGNFAMRFTRSSNFRSRKVGSNKIEVIVTPERGVTEEPYQCENRMGYIEAIALAFTRHLPAIEHTECIFEGGKACRYVVSWSKSPVDNWKMAKNIAMFCFFIVCIASVIKGPISIQSVLLPITFCITLLLTLYVGKAETQESTAAFNNLRDSSEKYLERVNLNYNHALTVNEIGLALSKHTNINATLSEVAEVLESGLDFDRGMILLANEDKTLLTFRAGFGYTPQEARILKDTSFHLDRQKTTGVFRISFQQQKPFLINDINDIGKDLTPRSLEFARQMGVKSFICCPIIFEDHSLGVLAVDNIQTKRPLLQTDMNLLMGIAPAIGISIHNSQLMEAKEAQFKSLLQVMATTIDARDFLTSGHSEQVSEYAVGIAREMGLDKEYCEMIRVAALLHDYGKIGVRDSILKKHGKLTPAEYEEIKTHAATTRQILEKVNFEGIYKEVPRIAGSHHEKVDGTGYPDRLKGDQIPLGARIIAVADVFEAITSLRHYRDPMTLEDAFKLLEQQKTKHLDAEIVDAFFTFYNKEYIKLI